MPKVDVNAKRGYEASIPVEKIWNRLKEGTIEKNLCVPLGESSKQNENFISLKSSYHVLAAGAALSGVGMFRRVALATLLKFNESEDLKFILIDPLKISFYHFRNIENRLLFPIAKKNIEGLKMLEWAKKENDRRYALLLKNSCRDIGAYNKKHPKDKIPRIVIFITELGELMDFNKKLTVKLLLNTILTTKLLGIHFIITTQRPTIEVIDPLLTANISAKIAFQTGDRESSLAILGRKGAERLLGQGDMLVDIHDESARMQGYCLEEEEVEKIDFK